MDSDFGLCGDCWRDTPFIGGTVCDACGVPLPGGQGEAAARCDQCLSHPPPWNRGRAVMLYAGTARRLVMQLKHGDRQDIAAPAARWLAEAAQGLTRPDMLIAPVPLHRWRLLGRGYNQSALLTRRLGPHLGLRDIPDLLQRPRATPSLDGKSRTERQGILAEAIRVTPRHAGAVAGRPVLLVDDVMTSGATFSAATGALLAAGSGPVTVLALARVGKAL